MGEKMPLLNLSDLKIVIFDWDNTLAQSRPALLFSINLVLAEYGLPGFDFFASKRDPELSFKQNFPLMFGPKAQEIYDRYREIYKANVKELISAFPGTHNVLEFFHRRGIKLMIMTNKERCLLEYELPLLYDASLFEKIVCGQEAPRDKPFGDQALYALEGYLQPEEITADKVWIIGDSTQDSDCALAVGALPIRIGQPIWGNDSPHRTDIHYFSDFVSFFDCLGKSAGAATQNFSSH